MIIGWLKWPKLWFKALTWRPLVRAGQLQRAHRGRVTDGKQCKWSMSPKKKLRSSGAFGSRYPAPPTKKTPFRGLVLFTFTKNIAQWSNLPRQGWPGHTRTIFTSGTIETYEHSWESGIWIHIVGKSRNPGWSDLQWSTYLFQWDFCHLIGHNSAEAFGSLGISISHPATCPFFNSFVS